MKIRTDKAIKALGLPSRYALAQWFGIERQAVYKWGRYMPEARAYQLLAKEPELWRIVE